MSGSSRSNSPRTRRGAGKKSRCAFLCMRKSVLSASLSTP
uniref:Uncharacterized protein n=1 Tax=Leuconostoc citreum TaxID=33964 RepID=A0A0A1ITX6_LEUCI|nr:Protein of unknown function [Leuconostoc citreum]